MITISNAQFEELFSQLTPILNMLDALCYRNNNQHRHSLWWRDLCILRRAVRKLLDEESIKMRPERVRWLGLNILPTSYFAFTQLTADNQFAQLGITLITMLASIHEALQPMLPSIQPDSSTSNTVVSAVPSDTSNDITADVRNFDMGVAISRPKPHEITDASMAPDSFVSSLEGNELGNVFDSVPVERKTYKKKAATDTFDGIFRHTSVSEKKASKASKAEPLSIDDIFSATTSKSKKKKPRSTARTNTTSVTVSKRTRTKDQEEDINIDNIYGQAAPKPRKNRITQDDDIDNIFAAVKPKEKKTKTKETIGFDDIFGDVFKKDKKKKKPKSGSGTDMSDIFTGL